MSKKYKRLLGIITIICIIILVIDLSYLIYIKIRDNKSSLYFDSINSFEVIDDGYIVVGSNNNNNNSYEKAKITKYNKEQKKVWEKVYNKKYSSSYFNIKKDNKYYIAVGNYEANKVEHEENVRSALIVKYDLNGKIIKENDFQLLGNSKFMNVYIVDDGYIVVGQSIYENMTLGLSNEGGAFIIKYDKDLKEVWKSNYGGSKSGIYNDIIIVNDYIYVVGKDSTRTGVVSKYDLDGNIVKTVSYNQTDTLGFTGIVNIDSHIYVVGSKKANEKEDNDDTDALIVKYDLNLNRIDENKYIGKGNERYNKAIVDNKNIIIVGQSNKLIKSKIEYKGIFSKYSEDLNELIVEEYSDGKDNFFTDVKKYEDKYIIGGYSTYKENEYLSKFITYTSSGKVIGVK